MALAPDSALSVTQKKKTRTRSLLPLQEEHQNECNNCNTCHAAYNASDNSTLSSRWESGAR